MKEIEEKRERGREADHEERQRRMEADHLEHLKRMDEIRNGPPVCNTIITQRIFTPAESLVLKMSPFSSNQVTVSSISKVPVQKLTSLQLA